MATRDIFAAMQSHCADKGLQKSYSAHRDDITQSFYVEEQVCVQWTGWQDMGIRPTFELH